MSACINYIAISLQLLNSETHATWNSKEVRSVLGKHELWTHGIGGAPSILEVSASSKGMSEQKVLL
ncbi:MAG: hypothetical protein K0Q74_498 [Gammaproteobacteria bacterium]|jgi:hypothetical protein|nr:hypothetical protein [Gammaproteobacteria bacterium]